MTVQECKARIKGIVKITDNLWDYSNFIIEIEQYLNHDKQDSIYYGFNDLYLKTNENGNIVVIIGNENSSYIATKIFIDDKGYLTIERYKALSNLRGNNSFGIPIYLTNIIASQDICNKEGLIVSHQRYEDTLHTKDSPIIVDSEFTNIFYIPADERKQRIFPFFAPININPMEPICDYILPNSYEQPQIDIIWKIDSNLSIIEHGRAIAIWDKFRKEIDLNHRFLEEYSKTINYTNTQNLPEVASFDRWKHSWIVNDAKCDDIYKEYNIDKKFFTLENNASLYNKLASELLIKRLPILGKTVNHRAGDICLEEADGVFKFYIAYQKAKFEYEELTTIEEAINKLVSFYERHGLVDNPGRMLEIFYQTLGLEMPMIRLLK